MVKYILLFMIFIFSGCEKNSHIIAKIPEASGIAYCKDSAILVVANDEGKLYEISKNGKILHKKKLGKYDLEGVVCEKNKYIFADERGGLLFVDRKNYHKKFIDLKLNLPKNKGIEGIVKIKDKILLAIQSKKKKDAEILVYKDKKIVDVIKTGIIDMAGLEYHDNKLYIVSDTKDKLYIYDLKKRKIIKKRKLPKFAQEGIAISKDYIFYTDDNGRVLRYLNKDFL